jgi:flagellar biosynthetic protein FliR
MLILARVSAFLVAAPVFGSGLVPKSIKVGMTLILTAFFLYILPPKVATPATPLAACLLMGQEVVYGLAIGLAAHMVYLSVQQAGVMLAQQMGLADAEVIDPTTGQESESLATFMELTFAVLFLGAGGHHLLLAVLGKSYHVFAAGTSPDIATMAGAITTAGSTMMLFALKLAAPCLAAFLVLTTVLAVLARALPDLNIFFESYPLRMGLGMIMAAAMMPSLGYFNGQLSMWIQRIFT